MQNVTGNTLVLCLWRLWLWPVLTRSARQPHIALVLTYRHRTLSRPTHGHAFRLYWTTKSKTKSMSMSMPMAMTKPNEKAKPRARPRAKKLSLGLRPA